MTIIICTTPIQYITDRALSFLLKKTVVSDPESDGVIREITGGDENDLEKMRAVGFEVDQVD